MNEVGPIIETFKKNAALLNDQDALRDLFSATIKEIGYGGFDAWCLQEGTINNPKQPGNFVVFDYNLNLVPEYVLKIFLTTDPVMPEIGKRSSPFDFVRFLEGSAKNSSVKWQLRMLKLFNVHHAWLTPANTVGANRGVTCYITGKSQEVLHRFENTRIPIQLISCEFMEHLARVNASRQITKISNLTPPKLSTRELDCLQWTARGKTNAEIAEILEISQNTVRFHLKNIFTKFDVNTRSNAVLLGIKFGMIDG